MHNITLPVKILIMVLFAIPAFVSAQISPHEAISRMTKGINMGNTLESPNEGDWSNGPAQEYYFNTYKNTGFDCVRIPVRWDMHLEKMAPYTVNETWFKRVEQIIDWGLARGFFIIVNSHHDDWIKDTYDNPINQARFDSLWSQIAVRFKNKSEKLIFEICNEPVNISKANTDEMHRKAINIVRKTNPTRLIIFQGTDWGSSSGLINAAIPNDPYLIGSFHTYDPWPFGLQGTGTFTSADANALRAQFQKVKDWSVKNNIPVLLGEFGGTSKCEYNSRMRQYKTYMELVETFGFASCVWEDGGEFKIMNRSAQTWYDDLKDIVVNSSVLSPKTPRLQILQDTIVKLDWLNPATDYDSIYIERRTGTSTFQRIASLPGNAITFSEHQLKGNIDYFYRVVAHYSTSSTDLYSYPLKIFVPFTLKDRRPYTGQAIAIPGKVETENFDFGGEGFTYHDNDLKNVPQGYRPDEPVDISDMGNSVYFVIDNYPGEWLEYTVNVANKGLYDINASIAAFAGGGTFRIKIGAVESEIIIAPTTYSWVKTKQVSFPMNLEAGIQNMRLTFIDKPLFYIDNVEFIKKTATGNAPILSADAFTIFQDKDELIVSADLDLPIEDLKIYNILGTVVKTVKHSETNLRISTIGFHSGVYIVQLSSRSHKLSKKIIVQ